MGATVNYNHDEQVTVDDARCARIRVDARLPISASLSALDVVF